MKSSFSLVIPTLNEEKYLPGLLNDLAGQTYKDFEVIIVDGGSEDKTRTLALSFAGKFRKFTLVESDKKNVSYQRNLGARKASSDWIIFFDADNRLPAYFLLGIEYFIETKKCDVISSWIEPDFNTKKDKATATLINLYLESQKNTKTPYLIESFIGIKKQLFDRVHGFNEKLIVSEGQDLIKRALKRKTKYELLRNPRYTYSFRRLRKHNSFKMLQNFAIIEIARLTNHKLSFEQSKKLYPMPGGSYWEIKEKDKNRFEKIILKTLKLTNEQIQKPTKKIWNFLSRQLL